MAWTLNGIRIFVTDFGNDYKQIIAKLNPLNGGTVYHTFGYDFVTSKLTCYVVGDTDNVAIRALTRTGTSYTLISDQGSYGDFLVNAVNIKRINSVCQTLRPDLDDDAPVYIADMELYLDE
jgi:hypothetical protein